MGLLLLLLISFYDVVQGQQPFSSEVIMQNRYHGCPVSPSTGENFTNALIVRSRLGCVVRCSISEQCRGVLMCPVVGGSKAVACGMKSTTVSLCQQQDGNSTSNGCYFLQKRESPQQTASDTTSREPQTTEPACHNGGRHDGTRCFCPLPFAGATCNRYMRDCQEGVEQGHSLQTENGAYMIQPINSASPFMVTCLFQWGGITYPLRWKTWTWVSTDWTTATSGLGVTNTTIPDSDNYFIGLHNLQQLLNQAHCDIHIFFFFEDGKEWDGAHYDNFTLGPGASRYELSFSSFWPEDDADNGLSVAGPLRFSTVDNNPDGCAKAGGWFGPDCTGFALFADPPVWPVEGKAVDINMIVFNVVRKSSFYHG